MSDATVKGLGSDVGEVVHLKDLEIEMCHLDLK